MRTCNAIALLIGISCFALALPLLVILSGSNRIGFAEHYSLREVFSAIAENSILTLLWEVMIYGGFHSLILGTLTFHFIRAKRARVRIGLALLASVMPVFSWVAIGCLMGGMEASGLAKSALGHTLTSPAAFTYVIPAYLTALSGRALSGESWGEDVGTPGIHLLYFWSFMWILLMIAEVWGGWKRHRERRK